MKKLLLVSLILFPLLMSTNAMAWWINDATVDKITVLNTGSIVVVVTDATPTTSTRTLDMSTTENENRALASLLTAQANGQTVNLWISSGLVTQVALEPAP